ncbi:MAG: transposase [Candidatus Pacebacteria bacterium]|nr:transposase [Candidatus Paceibacterota bacterium]
MGNRKTPFVQKEYYHIFNRGVDKRHIFMDKYDALRFLQSMEEFNNVESGNDIFLINKSKKIRKVGGWTANFSGDKRRLVNIICYCLNPNHYHFILEQLVEGGISEFMKRLNGGYTWYINNKYERSGALFQGKFKAVHIETNEQLLYASAYVNLNNKVHPKFEKFGKHFLDSIPNRSSWDEYTNKNSKYNLCEKGIILGQYTDINNYKKISEGIAKNINEKRYGD